MKLIEKQRQLVPYKTTWDLLAAGMYFQAWIRLSTQAKRAMRRRGYVYVRKEQ